MESELKKLKTDIPPISLKGSPELIAYRKRQLEQGLPVVFAKTHLPDLITFPVYTLQFPNVKEGIPINRNVMINLVLPLLNNKDVFSLLFVSKQFFDACHAEILKRARKTFGDQFGTSKALSCLIFYETAVSTIITNKRNMHYSNSYMDETYLAYSKLNKSRIIKSLLLRYAELNKISTDNRCFDPTWPLSLVLLAIRNHGCIDNLSILKAYALEQTKAKQLEQRFIKTQYPIRSRMVMDELHKHGFRVSNLEQCCIFETFVDEDVVTQFFRKLSRYLNMELLNDNPFYFVNELMPTGVMCSKIFNTIVGLPEGDYKVMRMILESAKLIDQDLILFGEKIGNNWEGLILSILKKTSDWLLEDEHRTVYCLWDKNEMKLSSIHFKHVDNTGDVVFTIISSGMTWHHVMLS